MVISSQTAPVITIDGPSGSGKGTIGKRLALALKWHFLDSGAIYRVLAYAARAKQLNLADENNLVEEALRLQLSFNVDLITQDTKILFDGVDITPLIRSEEIGSIASKVGALPRVRQALLERQRAFRKLPGLVTDGRDMGSVVFPDAILKIFLSASIQERARRRYQQLKEAGINVSLDALCDELVLRDKRDQERQVAPLKPTSDAVVIDTTSLSIDDVMRKIMGEVKSLGIKV